MTPPKPNSMLEGSGTGLNDPYTMLTSSMK